MLTGVVEVGLFCKMAQAAYFGNAVSFRLFFYVLYRGMQAYNILISLND